MRSKKFKILMASAAVAVTAAVVAVGTLGGPALRYITGRSSTFGITEALEAEQLQSLSGSAAAVAVVPETRYIVGGSATDDGYTLDIQADGLFAYTGRLALVFDTEKLELQGADDLSAFRMAPGLTAVPEVQPESEMVSSEGGYACLAWYGRGLDATQDQKPVASLDFRFKAGYDKSDIDASSFRLMAVEEGDVGPFRSAASFQGRGAVEPVPYEYLTGQEACGVTFNYEGSDRAPADGNRVTFDCTNNLEEPLEGLLELGGRTYLVEGDATVLLGDGEYLYRLQCDGYGTQTGRVKVAKDETVKLTFATDETLVQQAAGTLAIGYADGDSADHVTAALDLPATVGSDVAVSWSSSQPGVVDASGLVYAPEGDGVEVTLSATLTKGEAAQTKDFTVYVCAAKTPAEPEAPVAPEAPETAAPEAQPDNSGNAASTVKFTDLDNYGWAEDAIYHLASSGVIKGTSETTFTPAANVKRGDFVLMLMRMLDVENAEGAKDFADVPADSYYYEAISQARALGIAEGTGDNRFTPDAAITRQDMITLTMRAVEKTGYLAQSSEAGDLSAFKDRSHVAAYAEDSMKAAVGRGLIIGDNSKLNPLGNTTRAEAAVFIERILSAH